MLISELSKRSGFSSDTIRFYEKSGLIKVSKKERRDNNYKEYSENILKRLLLIKEIKGFGFTLEEIRELIFMSQNDANICRGMPEKIETKIKAIDEKIAQLTTFKQKLHSITIRCNGNCKVEDLAADTSQVCI